MKLLIAGIVFFLLSRSIFAQEPFYEPSSDNTPLPTLLQHVNVHQDDRIDSLLRHHVEANRRTDGVAGYRVEIFFSSGHNAREEALNKKTRFLKLYPEIAAYMSFQSPNFKVRIGDCRTKSDALRLKEEIRWDYPNAFIVPETIQFPKLYTETKNDERVN